MTSTLKQVVSSAVAAAGYEFVGIEDVISDRRRILRVYIDAEAGVNIDDCAKASRQIGAMLDVEETISGHYSLEVSSPGINRLLFELEHYSAYIGKELRLKLRAPQEGRRNFKGVLEQVNAASIILLVDAVCYELQFNNIAKAKLEIEI